MEKEYISTGKAARLLGVTPTTLRSWDKKGKFTSLRSPGGRRLFSVKKLRIFLGDSLSDIAFNWATPFHSQSIPEANFYCPNSAVFQSKISVLEQELKNHPNFVESYSLIVATVGEIGNNSFDHNLGNWPDVPGIFFGYDITKGEIVLADRGQGIFKTLKRVKPSLQNDEEALHTAFTEIITGRAPEERGNGLKFVRKAAAMAQMQIFFQSGSATAHIASEKKDVKIEKSEKTLRGCFASITLHM